MTKYSARFDSMAAARKAEAQLKAMGFKNVYLDATDGFTSEYSAELNFTGSKAAPSLSALVLKSGSHMYRTGKDPLIAAHPMVSGMGGYHDNTMGLNSHLVVKTENEADGEKLKEIVYGMEGTLEEMH